MNAFADWTNLIIYMVRIWIIVIVSERWLENLFVPTNQDHPLRARHQHAAFDNFIVFYRAMDIFAINIL
jgi:hypothetical protein